MNSISDTKIFPCIWMNDTAAEAMEYYLNIFDNSGIQFSNDIVVYGKLEGSPIMFLNGNSNYDPNPSVSIMVLSNDKEKITRYYNQLKAGGEVLMPIGAYPYSEWYSWVKDKYGMAWQLYTGDNSTEITDPFVPTLLYSGKQQGKCKTAIQFFQNAFPNFNSYGILEYSDGPLKGQVMHSQFKLNNNLVMAMDDEEERNWNFNETISMVIECTDQQAIDHYWDSFIQSGGTASKCGWLTDQFGMSWQIAPKNVEELLFKEGNNKAFENMLKMEKIIIADLI